MSGRIASRPRRGVPRIGPIARALLGLAALSGPCLLVPRVEAGGQAGVAAITQPERATEAGAWVDLNFASRLALETRLTATDWSAGNTAIQFESGVRATFVRTPRLALFGGPATDASAGVYLVASSASENLAIIVRLIASLSSRATSSQARASA